MPGAVLVDPVWKKLLAYPLREAELTSDDEKRVNFKEFLTSELVFTQAHSFEPRDWRRIEVFRRRSQELLDVRSRVSTGKLMAHVHRKGGGVFEAEVQLPPEDGRKLFYQAFRPFCLKKEDCYFPAVKNVFFKVIPDKRARAYLRRIQQQWQTQEDDSLFEFIEQDGLDPENTIDLWFNTILFHSDEAKEPAFNKSILALGKDLFEFLLYHSVLHSSLAISNLYHSIKDTRQDCISFAMNNVFLAEAELKEEES